MAEEKDKAKKANKANIVKASKKVVPGKEKMKLGARIKKFFKDYKQELKNITWPKRPQVIKNTGVVLVVVILISAIVGVVDLIFGLGINALSGLGELFR